MYRFKDFVVTYKSVGEDEFLHCFSEPFLVIEKKGKTEGKPSNQSTYTTISGSSDEMFFSLYGKRMGDVPSKISLLYDFNQAKQAYIISIGRTESNSIVLKDNSMSKFHAYFQRADEDWILVDAGSSNGTFLNGNQLEKKSPVPLQSHDGICFSMVYLATFFSAQDFYKYIQSIKEKLL